jgi:uncharacterized repeat protein (TIGR01451 family)
MHKFIRLLLFLALVSISLGVSLNPVFAQGGLLLTMNASPDSALLGDDITYTYIISNISENQTDNITLSDDIIGNIPLIGDNGTVTSLAPGENITAVATHKVVWGDLMAGTIKNTATVTGVDPNGNPVTASSGEIAVSTDIVKALLTKAQVLKLRGVPGKGIDKAPGLQKPFNPNSHASENVSNKDGVGDPDKNKHSEISENSTQNLEQNTNQVMNRNNEQNQEQGMNVHNEQDEEQEMNVHNEQNQEQETDNNQGKGKGKGPGNNNK